MFQVIPYWSSFYQTEEFLSPKLKAIIFTSKISEVTVQSRRCHNQTTNLVLDHQQDISWDDRIRAEGIHYKTMGPVSKSYLWDQSTGSWGMFPGSWKMRLNNALKMKVPLKRPRPNWITWKFCELCLCVCHWLFSSYYGPESFKHLKAWNLYKHLYFLGIRKNNY